MLERVAGNEVTMIVWRGLASDDGPVFRYQMRPATSYREAECPATDHGVAIAPLCAENHSTSGQAGRPI
jgi:hypothetical protein